MAEIPISLQISPRGRRRSLIPLLFAAAMLPVIVANAALAYFAIRSTPSLVSAHPFEDGRTYNREIAAAAAQDALGWTAELNVPSRALVPNPIQLNMTDRSGVPVSGLAIELRAWRPVGVAPDLRTRLLENGPGQYTAQLTLPLTGQWQLDLVAKKDGDEYVLGRRIIVR